MNSFYFNLLLGFQHVLDLDGLDHLFFIVVLVINHTFKMWKKTFIWVTFFTLGHTISLFFGNYYKIETSSYIIELLISITILLTAISSLRNKVNDNLFYQNIVTFSYGIIHGFGFGKYFRLTFQSNNSTETLETLETLLSFALGIEFAQILIVLVVISLNQIFSKKETLFQIWRVVIISIVILASIQMIFSRF